MQKIEYGDLYKFLVSVGVILIGFAVLIPYFYLKEDFGLCVPQSDMARFEPEVRQIIRTKQQLLLRVQNYVPYLSLAMFATGLLSVAAGLYKWSRRQRQADAKFDLEVKRLDLQIRALSPEETKEKIARGGGRNHPAGTLGSEKTGQAFRPGTSRRAGKIHQRILRRRAGGHRIVRETAVGQERIRDKTADGDRRPAALGYAAAFPRQRAPERQNNRDQVFQKRAEREIRIRHRSTNEYVPLPLPGPYGQTAAPCC